MPENVNGINSQASYSQPAIRVEQSQLKLFWRQFQRHKLAYASLIFLTILFVIAGLGKWIMPYDPNEINLNLAMGRPQPPNIEHLLGVDDYGRDILSRAISGAQISLSVGFVAVAVALVIGVVMGSLAGFMGGWIDNIIMRTVDIFLSVPSFFLILTVNAYLSPSIYNVMVILGLFSWMGVARLVRGEILRLKEQEFISAARAIGVSGARIVTHHLLPNSMGPVIVSATLRIPWAILTESALSFLGLGVPPPQSSWGSMLNDAKPWLDVAWWLWIPPGLLISLTVVSLNFIGDGLRDALDPLQRR